MEIDWLELRNEVILNSENLWQTSSLIAVPIFDKKCGLKPVSPLFIYFDTRNIIPQLRL